MLTLGLVTDGNWYEAHAGHLRTDIHKSKTIEAKNSYTLEETNNMH
jgi:hypothetical protein